jgi:cytosolic carboxypeptidase protein 2/3
MQWFFFSVRNSRKTKVKFNIFRFRKRYSLFQRGFRPYVRSRRSGLDWGPGGEHVKYYREFEATPHGNKATSFYFLSFYYTFEHDNDEVFFAACVPYTASFLTSRIAELTNATMHPLISFERTSLCKTLCGNEIDLLSIEPRQDQHRPRIRTFIIINARSHPGETCSSWVVDGLLQGLASSEEAQTWMLMHNVCFRVVPMLNRDGVFVGNYRTGIVGDDFNRKFYSGQREFFPEIAALKRLVAKCKNHGKVALFLDLHGHSVLKGSFLFGPDRRASLLPPIGEFLEESSKYFRALSCKFKDNKKMIETARVYFQFQE